MADIIDEANDRAALFLEGALRSRQQVDIKATGKCLCCEAKLAADRRWCGRECRDIWQQDQRRG